MRNGLFRKVVGWLVTFLLACPMDLMAETATPPPSPEPNKFTQEQIDRLLAPIALYPDALLAQILMASTYPLEVVEADRWRKAHLDLTGQSLDDALQEKPWDPSVKSLCNFPTVLDTMSEKIEDTAQLGDAFLEQQDAVMDTVQNLRAKARAEEHLRTTDRQKVVVEGGDITIEPAQTDVIYIPTYDPCTIYGPWWYPTCSPPWFWYPGVGVGLSFGTAIFIGPIAGWCGFYWHRHQLFVNVNKMVYFNRIGITRMHGGREVWRHSPYHRRGLAYFGRGTRSRFAPIPRPGVEARHAFRGFQYEEGIPGAHRGAEHFGFQGGENPHARVDREFSAPGFGESRHPNAFGGFGHNRNEVDHFSERGRESMGPSHGLSRGQGGFHGGSFHGGGFQDGHGEGRNR
jgi:hypothetical protein